MAVVRSAESLVKDLGCEGPGHRNARFVRVGDGDIVIVLTKTRSV